MEAPDPHLGVVMHWALPKQRTKAFAESLDGILVRHRALRARNPADYDAIAVVMEADGVHRQRELEDLVIAYDGEVARLEATIEVAYKALDRGISGILIARGLLQAALDHEP